MPYRRISISLDRESSRDTPQQAPSTQHHPRRLRASTSTCSCSCSLCEKSQQLPASCFYSRHRPLLDTIYTHGYRQSELSVLTNQQHPAVMGTFTFKWLVASHASSISSILLWAMAVSINRLRATHHVAVRRPVASNCAQRACILASTL